MSGILDPFQTMLANFITFIPNIIAALVIFLVSLYLAGFISKILKRALTHKKIDVELILLISKSTRWTIIVLGIIAALQQVGFNVTAFLAGLGILGFTIGFALQDVSKNFLAGMLLLLQQPFDIGDVVEVNDYIGTVLDVDLRATELRTFDGKHVLIPNTDVFMNPITNYSREPIRRVEITVGVAYDTDLNLARKVVLDLIPSIDGAVTDPAAQVVYSNLGSSSIDFVLYFWVDTNKNSLMNAKDQAILAINNAFKEHGIEMPYPTQTILLKNE